ncbi:OmpA family protein [Nonlabens ponticola]|uniref:Flagellar motor protein MotB n=1 Tax=Nonlabens ponticola TaxID=2496866 RepID=A0A3S9N0P6_9FLAO|nr:OmpA family protein [Nonlabens ponticola]AZQ42714.1 flagellar motor protein MotB [Nonlabens ponticola]AZQ45105.1 flagellar motor protein MotB [Nonlabens ponticola]
MKKHNLKNLLRVPVILFFLVVTFAQAQKADSPRAERKVEKYAFIEARDIYQRMADRGFKSVEIFSNLGDSYYFNNDYSNALKWYNQLFKLDQKSIPTVYFFRYAQALKSDKQYDKANQILSGFNVVGLKDSRLSAARNMPNFLTIIDFQKGRFEVEKVSVNSDEQDFGTAYYGPDKVVFASARDTGVFYKRTHSWNERYFLDLYIADRDAEGKLSNPEKFDKRINSILHESTPTFTADLNTMYFTRNNYQKGDLERDDENVNRLQIFKSVKKDGKWSRPERTPFSDEDYTTSHPALTPDGKYLYFSSNMLGTMGMESKFKETDIWRVAINEDGSYGEPENMSPINTEGRESYPYISRSGNLYFASNGLQGLGGLDIFVSTINDDGSLSNPVNIGEPANSTDDDFAFIIDEGNDTGYFSSNRIGGGNDDEIYRFIQLEDLRETCEQFVTGTITDKQTGVPLENAVINVIDVNNNIVASRRTRDNGKFAFKLACDKTYFVRGEKRAYNTAEELVNTPTVTSNIDVPLALQPTTITGKVGDDLAKLLNLNPIYFDFDRSFIREDAELELQKVLAVLEDNPTMKIDIRSHTDSRGNDDYNEKLSSRRAMSTMNYLISKGVDASRLTSKGYGEYQLINECSNGVKCSEEQHQLNRRSEFIIVER